LSLALLEELDQEEKKELQIDPPISKAAFQHTQKLRPDMPMFPI
jgi:hypothetical protein